MTPPAVEIQLDKPRRWRFSANAIIALYKALGKDAFKRLEIFQPIDGETDQERQQRGMDTMGECLHVFVALLWCGLLGEDKDLQIEAVGEMIGPNAMTEILPKLLDAANVSMSGNPTQAPTQTGKVPTEADSRLGHSVVSISDSAKENSASLPSQNTKPSSTEHEKENESRTTDSLASVS